MGVKRLPRDPISNARRLRKESTEAEKMLWSRLRRHQLLSYQFRRQEPIGPFIVDFVCYKQRLIIELDGGHHRDQEIYDADRTQWLQSRRYHVLRFWNNDVLHNLEGVLTAIVMEIEGTT